MNDTAASTGVPKPPCENPRAIVASLNRETVREYRQALISAAVTGKIDVRGEAGNPA